MEAETAPQMVGLLSIWVLGLSVGLTACTVTCLPFMGALVVGGGHDGGAAFRQTAVFALGKVAAYVLLGGAAGALGEILLDVIAGNLGHWLIGGVSILAGIWLVAGAKVVKSCATSRLLQGSPPFLLGFALSFVPCAPLAALLAAAALAGDPAQGLAMGGAFGLGAALTPLFLVLPMLGLFGREMLAERPHLLTWMRWGGAVVLAALGLRRIFLVW
ncbi:MAG: sulfite exporter TauE/SafE family protein [Proteobacteria bacterium]|nr:sulfite exporter TauE/SafE family protein [Pseudomonadota bacterium]